MKHILMIIAATVSAVSCSPKFYQQIATLSSDNVKLQDNGEFLYVHPDFSIIYDFWSESGNFSFLVSNNTDEDIYLNLEDSHFINNGYAYDYYQARTYSCRPVETVKDIPSGCLTRIDRIEYAEQKIVCIPSHSSKSFGEFYVSSTPYRECGFIRDPSSKENAVKEYEAADSPRIIENRLAFKVSGTSVIVNNVFYVSEYRNIAVNESEETIKINTCSGKKYVKINRFGSSDKFYISYSEGDIANGLSNDRTRHALQQRKMTFKDIY
ncbi:MAG: hypothetical protein NC308_06835 [Clostridium sp.]|nr:hypothetical protein [Bacteroides sp.]MCM1198586.1 hypothetical protein [Clostridium sp.]